MKHRFVATAARRCRNGHGSNRKGANVSPRQSMFVPMRRRACTPFISRFEVHESPPEVVIHQDPVNPFRRWYIRSNPKTFVVVPAFFKHLRSFGVMVRETSALRCCVRVCLSGERMTRVVHLSRSASIGVAMLPRQIVGLRAGRYCACRALARRWKHPRGGPLSTM